MLKATYLPYQISNQIKWIFIVHNITVHIKKSWTHQLKQLHLNVAARCGLSNAQGGGSLLQSNLMDSSLKIWGDLAGWSWLWRETGMKDIHPHQDWQLPFVLLHIQLGGLLDDQDWNIWASLSKNCQCESAGCQSMALLLHWQPSALEKLAAVTGYVDGLLPICDYGDFAASVE